MWTTGPGRRVSGLSVGEPRYAGSGAAPRSGWGLLWWGLLWWGLLWWGLLWWGLLWWGAGS
jgi:hypothetical protein